MLKWKVPVVIITGYLGSGKTTLLKNILKDADKKIAVLMNEFGEIGIDTKVIKGKNVNIKELAGGCVCCSLTGELKAAIAEILQKVEPEMIVVETTGVAEPDALITNLDRIKGVALDSVVTLVDADAFVKYPRLGHTGLVQIESADTILLNKIDLVDAKEIDEIVHALMEINPRAKIIKTTYSNLDTSTLFGKEIERGKKKHGPHELSRVQSFAFRSERILNRSSFVKFATSVPKEIYRAKGHVNFSDGTHLFNFVNGRFDFSKAEKQPTELIFIGEGIVKYEKDLIEKLKNCEM